MADITYIQVRTGLSPAVIENIKTEGDPPGGEVVYKPEPAKGWVNILLPTTPDIRPTGTDAADFGAVGADFTGTNFSAAEKNAAVGISPAGDGFKNTYSKKAPQLILNAGRVIMNASTDYAMVFGAAGVIISSGENSIHLDAEKEVVLHGVDGVFIGIPGGDDLQPSKNKKKPANKGAATVDNEYEPLVLGLKLANWLDDLIQVLQQATVVGLTNSYFREDTQENFRAIRARIPEMVSTYAFVDGISHELPNYFEPNKALQISIPPAILSGEFIQNSNAASDAQRAPTSKPATGPGSSPQIDGFFEENDADNPLD